MLNDVAIASDGAAYVTDSESGAVWRHLATDDGLVPFLPAGALLAPNGIARDGPRLLIAHASGVTVVTLASGARSELAEETLCQSSCRCTNSVGMTLYVPS